MAKKSKQSGSKQSDSKKSSKKSDAKKSSKKQDAKAALAADKQARKAAKAAAKQAKADQRSAAAKAPEKPDQVEVLKLALRDTEAKLVDAEHRLRQVQQQLDDERRALTLAAEEAAAEAIVDAAVAETVAEAVAEAELIVGDEEAAVVAEVVAETLDAVAAEADPVPAEPDHTGEAEEAAAVFTEALPDPETLTPPLPDEPAADVPSEEWTLLRLREEARRRGLTGTSNLSKARLVERLTAS
ncbi:MAG TPA: hypothetical protein VIG76_09250 [Amnibacterium sp.]|uniref:hypothetical protein n=1 Tax=Amnibacterium sp. TaxID=1872496 RepID=UPI002F94CE6B